MISLRRAATRSVITVLAAWIAGGVFTAQAQTAIAPLATKIEINVASDFEPANAVGFVFTPTKIVEKKPLSLRKTREGFSVVSFSFDQSDATKDAYVSAMVTSAEGQRAFGDVRRLDSSDPRETFFNLPACPPEKLPGSVVLDRTGRIGSLVEVRARLREASQQRVAEIMSGDFLVRLRKLEEFFGLGHGAELSPQLNPVDLVDRLSRLQLAINNYEIAKQDQQSAPAAAP